MVHHLTVPSGLPVVRAALPVKRMHRVKLVLPVKVLPLGGVRIGVTVRIGMAAGGAMPARVLLQLPGNTAVSPPRTTICRPPCVSPPPPPHRAPQLEG